MQVQQSAEREVHVDDLVDDYAHHPTEVRATLEAARSRFQGRRIVVVFQPHLYSRTRDFAAEFGAAGADIPRALAARGFHDFDDALTAPIHGFDGVDDYVDVDGPTGVSGSRTPSMISPRMAIAALMGIGFVSQKSRSISGSRRK